MTPNIDAEGIWQLVKDWPADARPDFLSYRSPPVEFGVTVGFHDTGGNDVDKHIAYHAFVGSGLAWLAEKDCLPALGCGGGWSIHTRGGACYATQLAHPLAAVSTAVLAAAKGGA